MTQQDFHSPHLLEFIQLFNFYKFLYSIKLFCFLFFRSPKVFSFFRSLPISGRRRLRVGSSAADGERQRRSQQRPESSHEPTGQMEATGKEI